MRMTDRAYYVELSKTVYFGSEVVAADEEAAQDGVLAMADGDPRDWIVVSTSEVKRFDEERSAIELLD